MMSKPPWQETLGRGLEGEGKGWSKGSGAPALWEEAVAWYRALGSALMRVRISGRG